ncbi:MAG: hypothetical protein ABJD07_05195 [Gemmatimonadaceae bacterium]
MLSTTTRASRPKDRLVIESRAAELTTGDRTDKQATLIVTGVFLACAVGATGVYLRGRSIVAIVVALVFVAYAAKNVGDLRAASRARVRKREDAATVATRPIVVIRCESTEMVKFDGGDSDYSLYAFQAEPDRLLVVTGEPFETATGFPSTAFEITVAEDDQETVLAVTVMGEPLRPLRTLPASARDGLRDVDDQEVLDGRLVDVERLLEDGE